MSIHLDAAPGQIAKTVLLPGDPRRAAFIAERYLQDAQCHNQTRGMLGFTGLYKGVRVSVQGTGMGMPSMAIYAEEILRDYGATRLIRVGTCGAIQPHVKIRDLVLAQSASTDSAMLSGWLPGLSYAPTASFTLLKRAAEEAERLGLPYHAGNVFTSDSFYDPQNRWQQIAQYGTLASEMETAILYALAARYGAEALSILTVSDHIACGGACTSVEREQSFNQMIELALALV